MLRRSQDVFESLRSHEVRYVVIGGIAAVAHGVPRATFDLDILIDPELDNAGKLLQALRACGFGTAHLISPAELLAHEITIFKDKVRIDVQTSTPGLRFEDAWQHHREMVFGSTVFRVVSREDLIAAKTAAGRRIDLEDVQALHTEPPNPD